MKRTSITIATILLIAAILGWFLGTFAAGTTTDSGQILAVVAVNLLIGLVVSFALLVATDRMLRSRLKAVSRQARRAVLASFVVLAIVLSIIANAHDSHAIRSLFGDLSNSSHLLGSWAEGWLFLIFMLTSGMALFYVFYVLYEEWVGRRSRTIAPIVTARDRRALLLKLVFGAVVVWLLMQATMTGSWIKFPQYLVETGGSRQIGSERNDSIVVVSLEFSPISHQTYLEGIKRIGAELDRQGAKVKLVVLPRDLVQSSHIRKLLEKIAQQGNVVLAVPPEVNLDEKERLVQNPSPGASDIDWGVASVVAAGEWHFSMRFFPLSYRVRDQGDVVPEAAVRVVDRFRGGNARAKGSVVGSNFSLGSYSTGLFKDGSAVVIRALAVWKVIRCEVLWSEENDTLWYLINNQRLTSLTELPGTPFKGKIVILDPGNSPGFQTQGESYGQTAAIIVHQILRGYSLTPIDVWTPWLVIAAQAAGIVLMLYLQPVVAAILIFVFAFGQPFLYAWIISHTGLVAEIMPPTLTAWWSVMILLFVRIFHERRRMEIKEKKRAEEELRTAHDMQMGLMPKEDPKIPGYEISGICRPADEVGGDFFDYVWLDDRKTRLGIAIGDVSGKAMKAAITAVMTSGMVYREVGTNETPKGILRKINKPMYLKTDKRIFTALSFAIIDLRKKKMVFSNAGQMQPLLKRGEKIQSIKVEGTHLPLGMTEDAEYSEATVQLRKGDLIVFHTDGVPEAMNEKNELFGFDRLESIVRGASSDSSAKNMVAGIMQQVQEFTGGTMQHDDMTVVVVKIL
jgi:serine phosphatase RsbU (regulator of sigma subunit)